MSAEATGWVFGYSPATNATLLVHLAIADSVNDQHDFEFWMAIGRLAEKVRVSRRTAGQAVKWLTEQGLLFNVEGVDPTTVSRPVRYRMLMPEGVRRIFAPVRNINAGGAQNFRTNPIEPNNNLTIPPPSATTSPPVVERLFEKIWENYPRKVGRKAALKAFTARLRAKDATPHELAVAVENYAKACRGKQSEFIMHGSTFFGPDERWRDYLSAYHPRARTEPTVKLTAEGRVPVRWAD